MTDLIAFNGFKGAGKDEAAQPLLDAGWVLVKFADPMRQILHALDIEVVWRGCSVKLNGVIANIGFDSAKREMPYMRRLLERIGTEGGRDVHGEDVWVNIAAERILDLLHSGKKVAVTDCRFDNEAESIRRMGGRVVEVYRPDVLGSAHRSEQPLPQHLIDHTLRNTGSLADLHGAVLALLHG